LPMLPPPPPSTLFPYTTLFRSLPLDSPRERRRSARARHFTESTLARSRGPHGSHGGPSDGRLRTRRRARLQSHARQLVRARDRRSEEHTSELQSRENLVCRLLL